MKITFLNKFYTKQIKKFTTELFLDTWLRTGRVLAFDYQNFRLVIFAFINDRKLVEIFLLNKSKTTYSKIVLLKSQK